MPARLSLQKDKASFEVDIDRFLASGKGMVVSKAEGMMLGPDTESRGPDELVNDRLK